MEDKTENTVLFKVHSQGLHILLIRVIWSILQRDIWFSKNSKKSNCVTIKDILTLSKQELVLAKYSRISILKMPGALAFQLWAGTLQWILPSTPAVTSQIPTLQSAFPSEFTGTTG